MGYDVPAYKHPNTLGSFQRESPRGQWYVKTWEVRGRQRGEEKKKVEEFPQKLEKTWSSSSLYHPGNLQATPSGIDAPVHIP